MKVCECGCGKQTTLIPSNHTASGAVKGEYRNFVLGHAARGQVSSTNYHAIHAWLRRNYPKSGVCEVCAQVKFTEYALLKGSEHSHDRSHYVEMCKRCHNEYDGIAPGGTAWRQGKVRNVNGKFERVS